MHDDAFVINRATGSTTALEPSYFDKVQDYPLTDDAVNYFLTCQNVGITLDEEGKKVLVLEDVRNGNGRTVKSRYVTPNRVDHLSEKIDAIFWIMKDNTLPPVIKINNPTLAAVFGLTLATKRSTAENLVGKVRRDQLVIEPYANPFRSYKLSEDYLAFRELFANQHTACYVLNTDEFNGKKVTKEITLGSIENITYDDDIVNEFSKATSKKLKSMISRPELIQPIPLSDEYKYLMQDMDIASILRKLKIEGKIELIENSWIVDLY